MDDAGVPVGTAPAIHSTLPEFEIEVAVDGDAGGRVEGEMTEAHAGACFSRKEATIVISGAEVEAVASAEAS